MMVLISGSSTGTGKLFLPTSEHSLHFTEQPVWPWEVAFLHGVFS